MEAGEKMKKLLEYNMRYHQLCEVRFDDDELVKERRNMSTARLVGLIFVN